MRGEVLVKIIFQRIVNGLLIIFEVCLEGKYISIENIISGVNCRVRVIVKNKMF